MARRSGAPAPQPRTATLRFDDPVPRHWLGGAPVLTHVVNGVNLLFPAGERFFIRAVAHHVPRLRDPGLQQAVRGFIGQEAQHAVAHERFFTVLEDQGYVIRPFLNLYEGVAFQVVEPLSPPRLRLATTAALEHFTALLAEAALSQPVLDAAPAEVRRLLRWHAAEELEHKHVAFDVLQAIDDRYGLRVAGLAVALVMLGGFWLLALGVLLWQDWRHGVDRGVRDPRVRATIVRSVFVRGIVTYLRPGFHPDERDNRHLAAAVFEREAA